MRGVSARWKRTIGGSFQPFFRATLVTSFQTGTSPTGDRLPILAGYVSLDGAAAVRGSLDMTTDGERWPVQRGDVALAPQGSEVFVEVGISYSDSLVEMLSLGYFRIKSLGQDESTVHGPIRIGGQDRMSGIVRAGLLAPRSYAAETTVGQFVDDLVLDVYPLAEITWDDDTNLLPLGRDVVVESSRYEPLSNVAQAYGKLMYWDYAGRLTFVSTPDPDRPVAAFRSGKGGTLMSAPRELSDEGVVNAVVARGDGADELGGAYGVAVDSDPNSPTGYFTNFGPAPDFITSSLIVSDGQANAAARAELLLHSGIPYSVAFTSTWRPEIEPFDAVEIEADDTGTREWHVVTALKIPIVTAAQMSGGTRQKSVILIGGL